MRFEQIIWLPAVEEKLYHKHHVIRREVEDALKISGRDMTNKERKAYGKRK